MATSRWHTFTEEQKQKHREAAKRRRAKERQSRTDEKVAHLREQRRKARLRRIERDPIHHKAIERAYRCGYNPTSKGQFIRWANSLQTRAKAKGVPYDLDPTFLESICPTHCPVLGVELVRRTSRKDNSAASPTVDRIFPERGYVRDNVIIVSRRANNIKSDASPDEILKVGKYYSILCEGLK